MHFHYGAMEIFTALEDVQNIMNAERKIVDILRMLVLQSDKPRRAAINSYINKSKDIFESPDADPEHIVSHPLNSFRLVKHFSSGWENLRKHLEHDAGQATLIKIEKLRRQARFPETDAIAGAAQGFLRLQRTYRIRTEDFAAGNLPGITKASALSAVDCYLVGHQQLLDGIYDYAASWLEIALQKWPKEKRDPLSSIQKSDILNSLQLSYYHLGNVWMALELCKTIREVDPFYPNITAKILTYQALLDGTTKWSVNAMKLQTRPPPVRVDNGLRGFLCRGEDTSPSGALPHLRCLYETHKNPYLILQPVKLEVVHVSPDIFILHDVILDSQIERLKKVAATHLQPATLVQSGSDKSGVVETMTRTAKSAFLDEKIDSVIAKINHHIGQMTNLDMEQAEALQIASYGIGGHYTTHYDFFRNPTDPDTKHIQPHLGDRMATVLIYLTDVQAGGATTFPLINVTLFPQKGSAAFWFNLHRDGTGDLKTLHEGCPVLAGNKWIANKWIREVGQWRTRPCLS
ncbi:Prolyl 4-hydroxylase subunit alpha-2 [Hypsibius exemplaris]|uniref:procollagen-proline 4-dioxygenase n=1 Tax=Hypsibius exemplaris TaxID=2072580 RepID=A0A1W0XC92_HYPEX|nr:Prolyl 4-hydroxylase subunit alpha-2 [Hypsibius exemplaris]